METHKLSTCTLGQGSIHIHNDIMALIYRGLEARYRIQRRPANNQRDAFAQQRKGEIKERKKEAPKIEGRDVFVAHTLRDPRGANRHVVFRQDRKARQRHMN